jgi:hypothetical protein
MPRSNRPRRRARTSNASSSNSGELDPDRLLRGGARLEQHPDGAWLVRQLGDTRTGANAAKTYRCPGCRQEIPGGTAHLVVWPAEQPIDAFGGVQDRRHWHTACWAARARRR